MVALTIALASGCTNEIWLSESPDASIDPPADASHPQDAPAVDAPDGTADAGPPGARACEDAPVTIGLASPVATLEQPTLAIGGRLESLRYGLLLPPAASPTATEDTRLIVADRHGTVLHERAFDLDDASGATASSATIHSLPPGVSDEGFLLLAPREIRLLDADGEGASIALAVAPSPTWQRTAGWIDDDRFVFVSATPDLRLAIFDRTTREVRTTSISAADAACVHVDPGGVTISSVGPLSETVVYDPDLSGAETLRTSWDDGALLGARLIAVGGAGTERTWLVRDANEFRTAVTSYRISALDPPSARGSQMLVGPVSASREGARVVITSSDPALTIYSLETHTFAVGPPTEGDPSIAEDERDGSSLSILTLRPASDGRVSLDLTCGVE